MKPDSKPKQEEINISGGSIIGSAIGGKDNQVQNQSINVTSVSESRQNLVDAAAEIQQLLSQLEHSYATNTISEKMIVAAETVNQIEHNPVLKQRVISALKEGSLQAFEKAIDHPIGSFVLGAIQGWRES